MLARQGARTTRLLLGAASQGRRYVAELRAAPSFSTAAEPLDVPPPQERKSPQAYPLRMPTPARGESEIGQPKQHIAPEGAADPKADKATTTSSEKPKRRRPLRARKAPIKLSETAVRELRKLLEGPEPKIIKVGVKQKGCSGLTYDLEYVESPGKFDEVVEQDGVRIVVDSRALMSVIGSEMHWEEDLLSRRFVFRNPNISESALSLVAGVEMGGIEGGDGLLTGCRTSLRVRRVVHGVAGGGWRKRGARHPGTHGGFSRLSSLGGATAAQRPLGLRLHIIRMCILITWDTLGHGGCIHEALLAARGPGCISRYRQYHLSLAVDLLCVSTASASG